MPLGMPGAGPAHLRSQLLHHRLAHAAGGARHQHFQALQAWHQQASRWDCQRQQVAIGHPQVKRHLPVSPRALLAPVL